MRRVGILAAMVAGLCMSGLGLAAPAAGIAPHAEPAGSLVQLAAAARVAGAGAGAGAQTPRASDADWSMLIAPRASVLAEAGIAQGTTIAIPVRVRCPSGERGYIIFAGLPDYFSDGRFAQPYLPGHTMPATFTCTGHWQRLFTVARSVSRFQDPATNPYEYFAEGRATAVVQVVRAADGSALSARRGIRIVTHSSS